MKYKSYKNSNIPWVGNIPADWQLIPNKALFRKKQHKVGDRYSKYQLLSLTTAGVREKSINDVRGKVPASYSGYQEVKPHDMIFCLFDLDVSAVFAGLSDYNGMITSAYDVAECNSNYVNERFADYWFKFVFSQRYYKMYSKNVRFTISFDAFGAIKTPVPSLEEQEQIARYLDWKISIINKLISLKRREIQLLKERKEAEINRAVTRGIKERNLKPSGLNWLPSVPVTWQAVPAKALFEHSSELRRADDEMLAATQKYGMITQKEYMALEGRRIVLATDNLDKWLHVEPDDFIISLRSFQGGLELCTSPGCVTWHYVVLKPREEVYVPYYKWLFKSASYIGALQRTSDFIRDGQDLRYSNFVKVPLILVPKDEQIEIAEYLEQTIPRFNEMEKLLNQGIELLQELKNRVIAEVVTGKIDVRNIAIPEYEFLSDEADDGLLDNVEVKETDEED